MRHWLRLVVVPALFATMLGAISPSAQAGLFDDAEARASIEELRKKLAETDKQAETLGRNQLDFANQIETLKTEIARIRGQLEVLTYEVEATQKRQKDFYVDLDSRLRKLEGPMESATPASPAGTSATTASPAADPAAENADYEAAVTALKVSKFRPAADGFQAFIKKYPASTLLASTHYWAAYAHSQLKEYAKAADLFGKFAAGWPNDERVPGALESQIASLEMAKDTKAARAATELLATKYPNSDAGKRAKLKLKKK